MPPLRVRADLGGDCNKGVLRIPRGSSITGTSPSDCLVSYPGHFLGSYSSTEMQSVYSPAPADREKIGKHENDKFGLHNQPNINGKYLTGFSLENSLSFLSTKLQKRKGELWTNSYVNNAKAQLDCILIGTVGYTLLLKEYLPITY